MRIFLSAIQLLSTLPQRLVLRLVSGRRLRRRSLKLWILVDAVEYGVCSGGISNIEDTIPNKLPWVNPLGSCTEQIGINAIGLGSIMANVRARYQRQR